MDEDRIVEFENINSRLSEILSGHYGDRLALQNAHCAIPRGFAAKHIHFTCDGG